MTDARDGSSASVGEGAVLADPDVNPWFTAVELEVTLFLNVIHANNLSFSYWEINIPCIFGGLEVVDGVLILRSMLAADSLPNRLGKSFTRLIRTRPENISLLFETLSESS